MFSGSYINEKVRFIVQDAVLDQPTNVGFLRAFTHMSLTCDPRAPLNVPKEIINALPPNAEISELEKERKALYGEIQSRYKYITRAAGTVVGKEYQQLLRKIASLKKRRLREIKKEFRRDYPYRIYNEELETRLKKAVTQEYVKPIVEHLLPKRTQLQKILYDLLKEHSVSAIVCRRISAINLMVALSRQRENRKPHKETPLTSPQYVSKPRTASSYL